ncbi:arylformamidase [Rhodoferax sp. OV413]|uniref:alpha/beta hydrolase n=1 Tax=Rhodoferax sp. OV413 TaxID=1855285 RepID=UPI000884F74B|nr:alpha/beta hydrolase [Rhodoferax sp. OV413]SDP72801.1 arylformamidase [Rhodoferax sp. OV413]
MQQPTDAQFQYLTGQSRLSFAALLPHFDILSADVASTGMLDIRYGDGHRECFDFFPARGRPRATLLFFHAGYWQSRDKSTFRFIAPAFTRRGLHVALVNYPLCPQVSLGELVDATRRGVVAVHRHVLARGQGDLPLLASGHSAGGHIAVELALTDKLADDDTQPSPRIHGVLAISGVYDLAPLVDTTLNRALGLDAESARRHSPVGRVGAVAAPALFAVGGAETRAFLVQTQRMHAAWQDAGHPSTQLMVDGADHLTVLEDLVASDSSLHGAVLDWVDQAVAQAQVQTA